VAATFWSERHGQRSCKKMAQDGIAGKIVMWAQNLFAKCIMGNYWR
jgi:hypothetical protein